MNILKSSFKAWIDIQMGRKWNCTRHLENWHLNEFKCQTPVLDSLLNIDPKEANVQDGLIIQLCHQSGLLQEREMGGGVSNSAHLSQPIVTFASLCHIIEKKI